MIYFRLIFIATAILAFGMTFQFHALNWIWESFFTELICGFSVFMASLPSAFIQDQIIPDDVAGKQVATVVNDWETKDTM